MIDITPVLTALGPLYPHRAGAPDVEYAILTSRGLRSVADDTWLDAAAVTKGARARIRRHLHGRYGTRSPRGGLVTVGTLLLVFAPAAPLGLLNAVRLGSSSVELFAAGLTTAIGAAALLLAACAAGRPVPRATLFQAEVLAVLLVGTAIAGVTMTYGVSRWGFIVGAALAAIAAIAHRVGRSRDSAATAEFDGSLAAAYDAVAASVDADRERMIHSLRATLSRRADHAEMRALRTATIAALREAGNLVADLDPDAVIGTAIVQQNTTAWRPIDVHSDAT